MDVSAPFAIERHARALRLSGELRLADAAEVWRKLRNVEPGEGEVRVDLDLTGAEVVDGAIMSLLVEIRRRLAARGIGCEIVGASARVQPLIHLYHGDVPPHALAPERSMSVLERIGRGVAAAPSVVVRYAEFIGQLVVSAFDSLRRPSTSNWRSVLPLAERAGADGIPIVLLLNLLVGIVMAYQSSEQLERYGANVYVADVVGISVLRELSPLMTAIIMSGRSGAAFAAELGTMKVSEELDALRTMGFAPTQYLVLPRVVALVIVAPVLTLLGDVVGVAGGAIVGASSLDVTPAGYVAELATAITAKEVWTGLVKSVAFAAMIALVGCHQGFATAGGAAGVGRRTTSTVVICLFAIVIIDTILTIFFRILAV